MTQKNKKLILAAAVVLLIASLAFGIAAISTINSSSYKHYRSQWNKEFSQHLKYKIESYDADDDLKDDYENLADYHLGDANWWRFRMEELEDKAKICGVIGGLCFLMSAGSGLVLWKKRKDDSASAITNYAQASENSTDSPTQETYSESASETVSIIEQ